MKTHIKYKKSIKRDEKHKHPANLSKINKNISVPMKYHYPNLHCQGRKPLLDNRYPS